MGEYGTTMILPTMIVCNYSRWCEGLRVMPGLRYVRCIMSKEEFLELYNELSEEDKEIIKDLLLEQEQRP